MSHPFWPGDLLRLHDRMYGLDPGLYVVTDFPFGFVEVRATWRNEDGRLSPTAAAHKLTLYEVEHRLFERLGNLMEERDV